MGKRGQGEGTTSKRADGTWWARITIGRDKNGKQKRKAFYGKTRTDVQKKMTAALNEMNIENQQAHQAVFGECPSCRIRREYASKVL
jgi:hypothetical protein